MLWILAAALMGLWALPASPQQEAAQTPKKPEAAGSAEVPKPSPKAGPRELLNREEVIACWEEALKSTGRAEEWKVTKFVELKLSEQGDVEFPSFSPDGKHFAFEFTLAQEGRKARFIRLTSLERLRQAGAPAFIEVRSPSSSPALPLPGGKGTPSQFDAQVYFAWAGPKAFAYYSRAEQKICRVAISEKEDPLKAAQLANEEAITLGAAGGTICYQDLKGIALSSGGDRPRYIVEINKTKDNNGSLIQMATMPAVCPTNPRVVAFIARVAESSSTDLCVLFSDGVIRRLVSRDDWEKLPSWSPDGKMIAFYSTRTNPTRNEYGIWAVRVNHERREISPMFTVSGDDQLSSQDLRDSRRTGGPAWSPDSRQILYFAKKRFQKDGDEFEEYYLRVYDIRYGEDEGALTVKLPKELVLNTPGDLCCSPAGGLIAFSNAATRGSKRDFHAVLLVSDIPGAPKK